MSRRACLAALLGLLAAQGLDAQTSIRRLTTIDAIRQYAGYYHLENVLVRGELTTEDARVSFLRADDQSIRAVIDDGIGTPDGAVDVRGVMIDVGRLEPGDPRLGRYNEARAAEDWPRPGEELVLRVDSVSEAPPTFVVSVRAIAIEPWRYDGQTVTVVGNFRGRNLFGDLPGAPGKSRYDFVLRGTEGAVWVTDLRPRGRGFDLDVNRRVDSDRWVEVTGTVSRERGLVSLKGTRVTIAHALEMPADGEPPVPTLPPTPVEVVFNAPADLETDVSPSEPIRIQFSRGLDETSLEGRIRVSYLGPASPDAPTLRFDVSYDAATRAISIRTTDSLEPFRTVRVELLEGIRGFDGAPVTPWTMTFSVGG
jgi:hypothetical protein